MTIPDVNLLLHAYDTASPRHIAARDWLEQTLAGHDTVGFAWVVLLGFLRMSTSTVIYTRPFDPLVALEHIAAWLEQPTATIVHPTSRHTSLLRQMIVAVGTGGNLTTDAHLAALAIEHGAELCSSDADFARFPGLQWRNPLLP
jgi:toxin-antitoxin system PIN domain toxin